MPQQPPNLNQVYCADAQQKMAEFADDCVDLIVTSPPYFRQRNYDADGQIGHEPTPDAYVARLVEVFREARRVLRPTGTLWLVLGDKYEQRQLLGLPWRVALALQADGWRLRSDIIWHKPNAMPSAVKDRPTTDHEYMFLLSKSDDYYYDIDAIREPHVTFTEQSRMRGGRNHFFKRDSTPEKGKNGGDANLHRGRWDQAFHPQGRNKRTVWSVPLSKCRDAHFAVFPRQLVEDCIKAGSPPRGVVLDPFLGSGTTALVARELGRSFVGIDCNPQYCDLARRRIAQCSTQLRLL